MEVSTEEENVLWKGLNYNLEDTTSGEYLVQREHAFTTTGFPEEIGSGL